MIKKETILHSQHNRRPFSLDYRYLANSKQKPVVLFVHGFKGFKDILQNNLIADHMAEAGFVYVKMNLSHNGVTPEHPEEFVDLEAFANNNFSIELDDIGVVIDHICSQELSIKSDEIDWSELYLIGHSRGGAVSILKACQDTRVKKLVTWAAVPDLETFWSEDFLKEWKTKRVQHIKNVRTHQDMPLNYQIVENFEKNPDRFRIAKQLPKLNIPFLAMHGTADETVPVEALLMLKSGYPALETYRIDGAGHTFGGKHPWVKPELPKHSVLLVERMIDFLKN